MFDNTFYPEGEQACGLIWTSCSTETAADAISRVNEALRTAESHDGKVTVDNEKLFFNTDYYDGDLSAHSPDPADPAVNRRVLTIMRPDE